MIAALGALKGRTGYVLLSGYFIVFSPAKVLAQIGLSSPAAQVVLLARSLPRGAVDSIGAASERRSTNTLREVSVPVRISANTPYRLMAIRTDVESPEPGRVWCGMTKEIFSFSNRTPRYPLRGESTRVERVSSRCSTGSKCVIWMG